MELLKERIRKEGKVRAGNILKVDSFLNHQMDVGLFAKIYFGVTKFGIDDDREIL